MTTDQGATTGANQRLDLLKTLGDNTRYAIYLEIARAASPRATADIAESLDLHVNTVRPHLERMRDVGLLEVFTSSKGGVGRPQHRYALAADAPSLGLEPPLFPTLARMLLRMAADVGADAGDAVESGFLQGVDDAGSHLGQPCDQALVRQLDILGFDPEVVDTDDGLTIGFANCPFADLAEANPALVCGLHQGMVEGFVAVSEELAVTEFRTLVDRNSCQVDLVATPEPQGAAT